MDAGDVFSMGRHFRRRLPDETIYCVSIHGLPELTKQTRLQCGTDQPSPQR